jgi:selenium metabolism protein YedF
MKEIDCRGMACPSPVLQIKAAVDVEGATEVRMVVDNSAAQQNVQRFLETRGYQTEVERAGADFRITGRAQVAGNPVPVAPTTATAPSSAAGKEKAEDHQKIMVLCASDRIGFGDDNLGQKLMANFIKTLKEMGPDLWQLVFVNNGVKLAIDGSPVLDALQLYEKQGLAISVCGTCLEHFDLSARKQVGTTTNMLDIVTAMQIANKVITI